MYICKECGLKFQKKPDFCDCGNDVFDEIIEENKTTHIEDSILKRNLPSIIFLIICIILSFVILFFIGNPKEQPVKKEIKKKEIAKNIPDIDKLWNDKLPDKPVIKAPVQQEIKAVESKETKIELKKEPVKILKPLIQQTKKTVNVQKTQQTKTQQTKPQQQIRPQAAPVKIQQQVPVKVQQVQKPTQQIQQTTAKPQATPAKTEQQTSANIQTTTPVVQPKQINPQELKEYKKALRNKIASNINFLNVAGDGKCILSFSISSSGALLNRKFVSQSSNTSLNDEVYSAMLKVSSFKTPPYGYKSETIKLTVQISGGNFSVSLE